MTGGGDLAAAARALTADFAESAGQVADKAATWFDETADTALDNGQGLADADSDAAGRFSAIESQGAGSEEGAAADATVPGTSAPADAGPAESGPTAPPATEPGAGQEAQGNGNTLTTDDPVDVVSGQLLVSTLDVALPGVLPLILRRAYASGYATGGLFGPGWSSTLDIRLLIDDDSVRFLGDDAQTLTYPIPPRLPIPVFARHGARQALERDRAAESYRVSDQDSALVWRFSQGPDIAGAGLDADAGTAAAGAVRTVPLNSISDRNGNGITVSRDGADRPTEIAHTGGYRIAVEIRETAGGPRVTGLRLLDGAREGAGTRLLVFAYDGRGRLAAVTDSSGVAYGYEWDERDRITAWIDRGGYRYAYEYDPQGRVVHAGGDGGFLEAALRYDPLERVTVVTDSLGHSTAYRYDRFGQITEVTDPLGGTVLTEHDRYGRLLSRTDELGNTTRIHRDRDGNPVRIEHPGSGTTTAEYEAPGQAAEVTGPDGTIWQYTYDQRGNLLTVTNPAGGTTRYTYAGTGALLSSTDVLGRTRTFETDPAGLVITATDGTGGTRATRDAFGRVSTLTDPLGATTRLWWNTEGRLVRRQDPDGAVEEWAYDPQGNTVGYRDAASQVSRTGYGPFRTTTTHVGPDAVRYGYTHDTELRLTRVTGPTGLTWDYEYDVAGRLTGERDFNGRVLRYGHDAAGRLTAKTDAAGQTIEYLRDASGLVVERRTGEGRCQYGYDRMGRLLRVEHRGSVLEYTRDPLGRVIAERSDGRELTRQYDPLGRVVRRATASGAVSHWAFDDDGLPVSLTTAIGELGFRHDALGRETDRVLGGGARMSQSFDIMGRLRSQEILPTPGLDAHTGTAAVPTAPVPVPLQARTYRYRADGLADQVTDLLRGDRALALDVAGQVTADRGAAWSAMYAYDVLGNLTDSRQDGPRGTATGSNAVAYTGTDTDMYADTDTLGEREFRGTRIRRAGRVSYEHDVQGRLIRQTRRTLSGRVRTWTYAWNSDDQLVSITLPDATSWSYRYDPLGRRIAKQRHTPDGECTGEVLFTWDGPRLAEQTSRSPDGRRTTLTWDWKPDSWQIAAQTRRTDHVGRAEDTRAESNRAEGNRAKSNEADSDAAFWAIVTDLTGSPAELIDRNGRIAWRQSFDLWGAPLGAAAAADVDSEAVAVAVAVDCPLRQPGQYHDPESGLHYNVHRYYDPHTARYLSANPLGLLASPNDYAYVPNPYDSSDPLGLERLRNPAGQFAGDPDRPATVHNRSSEYPHDYSQKTHNEMVRRWTKEGMALPHNEYPKDKDGVRIPRDKLTWRDAAGRKIDFSADNPLTYDHKPMAVEHWNSVGYNTDQATRNAWYDNPDHLEPMLKSKNSSLGAQADDVYRQDTGPKYKCSGG